MSRSNPVPHEPRQRKLRLVPDREMAIETRTHEEFMAVCAREAAGEFRLLSVECLAGQTMEDGYRGGNASARFKVWKPKKQEESRNA